MLTPSPGARPADGQSEALPGHEVDDHRVQGEQAPPDHDARKALPGAAPGLQQRGAHHQEEARPAQDGRVQPGVRPLPLVVGTLHGTRCHGLRAQPQGCQPGSGKGGTALAGSF